MHPFNISAISVIRDILPTAGPNICTCDVHTYTPTYIWPVPDPGGHLCYIANFLVAQTKLSIHIQRPQKKGREKMQSMDALISGTKSTMLHCPIAKKTPTNC